MLSTFKEYKLESLFVNVDLFIWWMFSKAKKEHSQHFNK